MLLPVEEYIKRREAYSYSDKTCQFEVIQTGKLGLIGEFHGIYAGAIPNSCTKALNLRMFEKICQEVFKDCDDALNEDSFTNKHLKNMKSITCAVVHWKLASQGGRANRNVKNVLEKWTLRTHVQLLEAYKNKAIGAFRIQGVRIPTATAFLRLLFPEDFGIMDSRVAKFTEKRGITDLSIRDDGYINDTRRNIEQYENIYSPLLNKESESLNQKIARFKDVDQFKRISEFPFRPCDVEMALWEVGEP